MCELNTRNQPKTNKKEIWMRYLSVHTHSVVDQNQQKQAKIKQ